MYANDIMNDFDHYYEAVTAKNNTVNFSIPHWHEVKNSKKKFFFTSLPDSVEVAKQHAELFALKEGDIVFDIGAYCGLSAILFADIVGSSGKVIAVEPDPNNYKGLLANIIYHKKQTIIEPLEAALWTEDDFIKFDAEASTGSGVVQVLDSRSGNVKFVKAMKLESIVEYGNIPKIDALKIDIEGSEYFVLPKIGEVLNKYKPILIVEIHFWHSSIKLDYYLKILDNFNYNYEILIQAGTEFPLIKATPR